MSKPRKLLKLSNDSLLVALLLLAPPKKRCKQKEHHIPHPQHLQPQAGIWEVAFSLPQILATRPAGRVAKKEVMSYMSWQGLTRPGVFLYHQLFSYPMRCWPTVASFQHHSQCGTGSKPRKTPWFEFPLYTWIPGGPLDVHHTGAIVLLLTPNKAVVSMQVKSKSSANQDRTYEKCDWLTRLTSKKAMI